MSNFWLILKVNLINTLKLNKLTSKKKQGKVSFWMILLVILGLVGAFGISYFYLLMFAEILKMAGQPTGQNVTYYILPLGISAGVVFTLFVTLSTANSYLFKNRDFDLLMSMPVKPRVIIASKISYLLIINYFTFALIFIPSLIVYYQYNVTSLSIWLLALPTLLITPLLPTTLGGIIAYLFSFVLPKIRYKNIFTIVLSLVLLVFFMFTSMQMSTFEENPDAFRVMLDGSPFLKPGIFIYEAIIENFVNYCLIVLVSIIPFIGFIYLLGKTYLSTNARSNTSYVNKNFRMKNIKATDQNNALRVKELKRYFGSPMYVLNTIIGPILSTIIIFVFYFKGKDVGSGLAANKEAKEFIVLSLTAMFAFAYSLTTTTSSAISIEGKQFWILKSLPVSEKQVFSAKIFVSLIITIPFLFVNIILSYFMYGINLKESLFILLIPFFTSLFMSYGGLFINLLFPRFDYDSDVKAVKQSLSVIVTMLMGLLGSGIIIGLGVVGILVLDSNTMAFVLALLGSFALFALFYILVNTTGVKLYRRLNP